jgi:hypothetical protein
MLREIIFCYMFVMIPGTKARNLAPTNAQQNLNDTVAQEPQLETLKTSENSLKNLHHEATQRHASPSEKSYSRRDLFTKLPDLFGEGIVKLLRTSNHLQGELQGKIFGEKSKDK